MAAPRPKKTTVKKKPPVKKKPSFLKKDTPRPARDVKPGDLRSQTLANDNKPRPAKDLNKDGLRAQFLKDASRGSSVAKGLIKKIPVVGAAAGFIMDAAPAGAGSDRPVGSVMKSNMPGGYGSKTSGYGPTPKKKASSFGKRISESAKFERLRATRAALGSKSSDSGSLRKAGAGTYTASYDVKAQKSGPSNTAATSAAASGSSGGSQAAKVGKSGVGRQTRYQRNETAMEQRKRSSGKPKKSIFSLFRKG